MAAKKYLEVGSTGDPVERAGTIVSSGAPNDGDLVALTSAGKLDNSVLPTGVGDETTSLEASENLSSGDFANVWNDAGTPKMRKADGSDASKEANGFVLDNVTSGSSGNMYSLGQINNQLSGMTIGAIQYLSTDTPGAVQETVPTTTNHIIQKLGRATSATELSTESHPTIKRG